MTEIRKADLHCHSLYSDGSCRPKELVDMAADHGFWGLSITDHDSTAGLEAVQALAASHPEMRLVPGLEMSAEGDLECHLLGYFVGHV